MIVSDKYSRFLSVLSLAEVRQESIESADLVVLSFDNAGLPNTDMQKWEDILDILLELSAKNKPALTTIYNRDGATEFTDAAHSYLSSFSAEKRSSHSPKLARSTPHRKESGRPP